MNRRKEKTGRQGNQKGVALIAVLFIIIILAFMGVMFLSMVNTASLTSVNDLQATRALYVAEGGVEYAFSNKTAPTSFPNYAYAATNLGAGSFSITVPSTLNGALMAATTPIVVNATPVASFPGAGRIVIDSEIISYTTWNGTTFGGVVTRGAGGAASAHANGAAVYPVTTLTADPGAGNTVSVNSTVGFLIPGTIKIDEEYIYCTGTNAPATTQFTGCTRGYKGTLSDTHPVGRNVFQYVVTSTGTVGNAKRQVEKAVAGTGNSFYKGWFAKATAAGNQVIIGVGFQPTAVIFYWTRQTASGVYATHESMGFGFASRDPGINQRSIAIEADDNVATTNYSHIQSAQNVILMLSAPAPAPAGTNATLNARASLFSFDNDGFTIQWVANEIHADIIHFIALGGDVTNAMVNTFTANTAAGLQAINTVGFQTDFVMFLNSSIVTTVTQPLNAVYAAKYFNIGFMTPANQGAISVYGRDARTAPAQTHAFNEQQTTQAFMTMTAAAAQDSLASFSSMNANGFTINWTNAPAAAIPVFYLALKGGQHKIGSFNQPNAPNPNQTTPAVGFQPQGLFLASFNKVAAAPPPVLPGEISIGAAQAGGNQGAIWSESLNVHNTDANMSTLTNAACLSASGTGAGAPTTNSQANFVRFNSNSFTLNWTAADATTRQILYWAVGPNIARSGQLITPASLDWREVFP